MRSRWRIWYLYINLAWTLQFSAKLLNRNCYRLSRVSWALAQITCSVILHDSVVIPPPAAAVDFTDTCTHKPHYHDRNFRIKFCDLIKELGAVFFLGKSNAFANNFHKLILKYFISVFLLRPVKMYKVVWWITRELTFRCFNGAFFAAIVYRQTEAVIEYNLSVENWRHNQWCCALCGVTHIGHRRVSERMRILNAAAEWVSKNKARCYGERKGLARHTGRAPTTKRSNGTLFHAPAGGQMAMACEQSPLSLSVLCISCSEPVSQSFLGPWARPLGVCWHAMGGA